MSADARKVLSAEEYARALHRGLTPATGSGHWKDLRWEMMVKAQKREQARKRQERRVLARLLLATRDR